MERKIEIKGKKTEKAEKPDRTDVYPRQARKEEEKVEIKQIGGGSYDEEGYATANIDEAKLPEGELKKYFQFDYKFDLKKAKFELDVLQNKMLEFYIRADARFRRAFYTDYTADFFTFLKDKTRLHEPLAISTMGMTRSGKSSSMISLGSFISACYRKIFTIDYICANAVEFLEKLKIMPEHKLNNSVFLIDEEKTFFGYGSIAKKMKLQDVQNIVAKMNISTIQINPIKFVNPDAFYGLRCFGRDFNLNGSGQRVCRFMLYNLQESSKSGGTLPMGCVYIPIFNDFLPDFYAKKLNSDYLKKKDEWIRAEVRGENDALAEIRKNTAMSFLRDKNFCSIDKKGEKMAYITYKLGSDGWTTKEIEDIFQLTKLLERGVIQDEDD